MENIIKKAIEGGYTIQQSYYDVRPAKFISLKCVNDYYAVFELDYTTVIEDETGVEKEVNVTSSHQTSKIFLDPLFWKSLGIACEWGWKENRPSFAFRENALKFHEINLTEGWDAAVKYLNDLIK